MKLAMEERETNGISYEDDDEVFLLRTHSSLAIEATGPVLELSTPCEFRRYARPPPLAKGGRITWSFTFEMCPALEAAL